MSKLTAFVDSIVNNIQNITFVSHRVENLVGKGENAYDPQVFLLFQRQWPNFEPYGKYERPITYYSKVMVNCKAFMPSVKVKVKYEVVIIHTKKNKTFR